MTGEISQDLDLFRMPVDLRIDTDGKTENKRIEVVGTTSPFSIETFGRPRRIAVDPDHHVLTNSSGCEVASVDFAWAGDAAAGGSFGRAGGVQQGARP